jgi:hypothetical protein
MLSVTKTWLVTSTCGPRNLPLWDGESRSRSPHIVRVQWLEISVGFKEPSGYREMEICHSCPEACCPHNLCRFRSDSAVNQLFSTR